FQRVQSVEWGATSGCQICRLSSRSIFLMVIGSRCLTEPSGSDQTRSGLGFTEAGCRELLCRALRRELAGRFSATFRRRHPLSDISDKLLQLRPTFAVTLHALPYDRVIQLFRQRRLHARTHLSFHLWIS